MNKVLCGNCIEIIQSLPDASVDALITDPPYGSGGWSNVARTKSPQSKYANTRHQFPDLMGDAKDQRVWMLWTRDWLRCCRRVLKTGSIYAIFIDWRQLPALTDCLQFEDLRILGVAVWDKRTCRPQMGRFKQQTEFIVWGSKGDFTAKTRVALPGIFQYAMPHSTKRNHITEKPLFLLRDLMAITAEGDLILDPFCGSGTTCLAALHEKRQFLGIELNPAYVEIAQRRLQKGA